MKSIIENYKRKQKAKLYKEKSRMERAKGILVEKETRI